MKHYLYLCLFLLFSSSQSFAQGGDDTCTQLKRWAYINPFSQDEARQQYDTLRLFIEKCAKSDDQSFHVFSNIDGAVYLYAPQDTLRFEQYRNWLISVLYLNTTQPYYYCACLRSIAGTYQYGKFNSTSAAIAILRYLRTAPNCGGAAVEDVIRQDSVYLLQHGLDTTIPSLEDLGLGFLLTHQGVSPSTSLPTIYLASFTSSPNPFKTETTLSFELNRMAYITVEVFDPLGRKVWGDDHGYSLDKGTHTVHLDGAELSSGTFYARISTGFGEVKTVKLVKQ